MLLTGLQTPHVKVWWDNDIEWTPELIKEKYSSYVQGYKLVDGIKKPILGIIVSINGKESGYIQRYDAHDFALEEGVSLEGLPPSLAFDIFIGDPEYIG